MAPACNFPGAGSKRRNATSSVQHDTCSPFILKHKRFRLPWLDGNANSSQIPGTFDAGMTVAETELDMVHPTTCHSGQSVAIIPQTEAVTDHSNVSTGTSSLPPLTQPQNSDSRLCTRSLSCLDLPAALLQGVSAVPGRWPTISGQIQYTPSTYSTEPPSESGFSSYLPKKSLSSYENLLVTPENDSRSKPPMWPMVPLSETEIPMRISSLSFRIPPTRPATDLRSSKSAYELGRGGSPSSIGRYNDGTISRKPTVRVSQTQARLDRAATMHQLQSPDVSPKSAIPIMLTSSGANDVNAAGSTSLERAVTGLHDLMREALSVATEAAQANQTHEVAQILNEATLALRKANTVQGRMIKPFQVSDPEDAADSQSSDDYISESDSDTYIESEVSSVASARRASEDTVPTSYTKSRSAITVNPGITPLVAASRSLSSKVIPDKNTHSAKGRIQPMEIRRATVIAPYSANGRRPMSRHGTFNQSRPTDLAISSSEDQSMTQTPPTMYHQPSADSIVTDWAYVKRIPGRRELRRRSIARRATEDSAGGTSALIAPAPVRAVAQNQIVALSGVNPIAASEATPLPRPASLPEVPRQSTFRQVIVPPRSHVLQESTQLPKGYPSLSYRHIGERHTSRHAPGRLFESPYYKLPDGARFEEGNHDTRESRYGVSSKVISPNMSLRHPRRNHISLSENQTFRIQRYRRQPIAREWSTARKRVTAVIACLNTALIGLTAGIYAGEVPKIQYQLADVQHRVILGNVFLYIGLGISTMLAWPLPLLHGRKPYTLAALAIALPLNFPQAVVVSQYRSPEAQYFVGLLLPRAFMGLALGFANVNFLTTLFDMFGASLQSKNPHQEIVVIDDIRRQGGGMGLWLGLWAWCFVGSLSIGFLIGAGITAHLNPAWGFYILVIIIAVFLLVNVVTPETRRAPYRRSVLKYLDKDEKVRRRVARGEVKLHMTMDGPKYWWEEAVAGIQLMGSMLLQLGFLVLAFYLAWIYALVVLVTLLLGALLSRDYSWRPQYIGLAVFALAVGAALAVPLSKANIFSRDRAEPARTDSMTFQPRITWTSHLLRRCIFTFALPIAGLGYCLSSPGPSVSWAVPTILSALVGFLSCLAIAECIGLIMETFDTSDLQPGVNTKHRLESMESATRRRRTNYSSFPRVTAAFFTAQTIGFFLAAVMTAVSGTVTRALGAQAATGVVVGILLVFTILLSVVLWRFKSVQVIPNHALGTARSSHDWQIHEGEHDPYFKPVIIGHPSGKVRRMNILESGAWSRWTEVRKLNKLIMHKRQ